MLQSEAELLQRRAVQGVLRVLKLDDLVKYGPQLVQQGLGRHTEMSRKEMHVGENG